MRRGAAFLVALCALIAVPAARADDSAGCSSLLVTVTNGRCDARRPAPQITVAPDAPRAGAPLDLTATSWGRGLSYAWDLDDDGAFDDGTGATAHPTFTAGSHRVRVQATDEDGRTGQAAQTFTVHATNLRPGGSLEVTPTAPFAGQAVHVEASGSDIDGHLARVDLDLDGDGTYERAGEEATVTFASAGARTLRARFVDDGGATMTTTVTVDVHAANISPSVAFFAPDHPHTGDAIALQAYATDADGSIARIEFDTDGDGSYETDAGDLTTVNTRFVTGGTHIVGVRVTDNQGAQTVSRRSIQVKDGNDAPIVRLYRSGLKEFYASG